MFKLINIGIHSTKAKNIPSDYHSIRVDPSYCTYGNILICKKEKPTFDEIINCLKQCFFKADYVGCYSFIYWEYYKEFYDWIKQSFEDNNTSNIRIIKKFYKKALLRWIQFVRYSDDSFYPQNEYFRQMLRQIESHLS